MAELNRIIVASAGRRTGLGKTLLAAGIAAAEEAEEMLLEVRHDNAPAMALYAAFGFEEIARRNNYYGGGVDAVVMRVELWRMTMQTIEANAAPLILGVESSCDETGFALVRGRELLANEVASSVERHARFGGVVPEVASRAHLEALVPTLERACESAGVGLDEIDAIAVTAGPGLMGALVVGVSAVKALALALDKPLYGVNHLAAHVAVDLLDSGELPLPAVALVSVGIRRC